MEVKMLFILTLLNIWYLDSNKPDTTVIPIIEKWDTIKTTTAILDSFNSKIYYDTLIQHTIETDTIVTINKVNKEEKPLVFPKYIDISFYTLICILAKVFIF